MEPTENQPATEITEEQPAPTKDKKRVWLFVGLGAITLLTGLMVLLTVTRDTRRQGSGLTAGDLEQKKYDAQQQINDRNKAAQIRNGSLLLRKEDADTQAQLDSLMGQLQKDPGTKIPVPLANDRQVQIEEEAIAQVIRERRPAASVPAYAAHRAPNNSGPAQQTTAVGGDQPMFVYSRTFGGAKFVDAPKSPPVPQRLAASPEVKADRISETAASQPVNRQKSPGSEMAHPGSKTSTEGKTTVIYSQLQPVTLFEGEMIDAVLVNRIIADTEPSPVVCQVSKDVFDNTGRYVVLPANSRIVGVSQVVNYKGAHRLFISFHRIILPNGPSIDFPPSKRAMIALDATGALGVVSKVERHWFLQFGTAIFFGVLDGIAGAAQRSQDLYSTRSIVLGRTSENFQRILDNIMAQYSSIVPTIRVDQGKKVRVYLSDDVLISPYAKITDRSYYASH